MKNWIKAIAILWGGITLILAPLLATPKAVALCFVTILLVVFLVIYTYIIKEALNDRHK